MKQLSRVLLGTVPLLLLAGFVMFAVGAAQATSGTPAPGHLPSFDHGGHTQLFAGAATANTKARPIKPRTLVATRTSISAFAQDGDRIAWVGGDAKVRVRSLSARRTDVVGSVTPVERASSATLALAGQRALWSWDAGGNSTESPLLVGARGHRQVEIAHLGGGLRGMGDGHDLVGVAGDGSTLAYAWVAETCPGQPYGCNVFDAPLVVDGGGVSIASWAAPVGPRAKFFPAVLPVVPPPALFALTRASVAVAPARATTPPGQWVPRVAEDGPVEVYDLSGHLLLRVPFLGLVRDLALSGRTLAVLLERPDGTKGLEQFDLGSPQFTAAARVPLAASEVSAGSGGIAFRSGRDIYVLERGHAKLVARAASRPIGLSIEGNRIAWAENVKGHGRIVALTAPSNPQMATTSASAAAPKRNGDILYVGPNNRQRVLYVIRSDGTHKRLIPGVRNVWFPSWSPDGKWIVYGSTPRPGGLCAQLYVIRADGSHLRRLTRDRACYRDPAWSPDRQRIAFAKAGALGKDSIWTSKLDGSGLRMLTDDGDNPAWSPDGRTIAFERGVIARAIWLMDASGANQRQLTMPVQRLSHSEQDFQPDWSPNGSRIAFMRMHDDYRTKTYVSDVFTVRSDGAGLRVLTRPHARGSMPAWSPDGSRIVFLGGDPARESATGLCVMKADGSGQKRLTKGESDWPDWRAVR